MRKLRSEACLTYYLHTQFHLSPYPRFYHAFAVQQHFPFGLCGILYMLTIQGLCSLFLRLEQSRRLCDVAWLWTALE